MIAVIMIFFISYTQRAAQGGENRVSLAEQGFIFTPFSLYTEFLPPGLLSLLPHSQYQPKTQENIFDHPKCY
jgi:hypothetical protein